MTGEDLLDVLEEARRDGYYVLVTPHGTIMAGPLEHLVNAGRQLLMLEQLPTEGVPKQ
jgi:hypothetical protein